MTTTEQRQAQSKQAVAMLNAGATTREIARSLGVSVGTAYTRARPQVHRVYQARRSIEFHLDQRLMMLTKAERRKILDAAVQLEEATAEGTAWRRRAARRTQVGSPHREAALSRLLDNLRAAQAPVTSHTRRAVWSRWPEKYPHIDRLRRASSAAQRERRLLLNMRAARARRNRSHVPAA